MAHGLPRGSRSVGTRANRHRNLASRSISTAPAPASTTQIANHFHARCLRHREETVAVGQQGQKLSAAVRHSLSARDYEIGDSAPQGRWFERRHARRGGPCRGGQQPPAATRSRGPNHGADQPTRSYRVRRRPLAVPQDREKRARIADEKGKPCKGKSRRATQLPASAPRDGRRRADSRRPPTPVGHSR